MNTGSRSLGKFDGRAYLDRLTAGLKGNISKVCFDRLWQRGLQPITRIRINRRNHLMPMADKELLGKRFPIETLFGKLKCNMELEQVRHRSVDNAFVHILSCLAACMLGKTPVQMADVSGSSGVSIQPVPMAGPLQITNLARFGHQLLETTENQEEQDHLSRIRVVAAPVGGY